mmetsp:Transcript_114490/g.318783  ORF Transcript_114490/g.318783 Transcript_114490/m.318783 type:complete len:249 (+) Transcript_114490:788-1534(+)
MGEALERLHEQPWQHSLHGVETEQYAGDGALNFVDKHRAVVTVVEDDPVRAERLLAIQHQPEQLGCVCAELCQSVGDVAMRQTSSGLRAARTLMARRATRGSSGSDLRAQLSDPVHHVAGTHRHGLSPGPYLLVAADDELAASHAVLHAKRVEAPRATLAAANPLLPRCFAFAMAATVLRVPSCDPQGLRLSLGRQVPQPLLRQGVVEELALLPRRQHQQMSQAMVSPESRGSAVVLHGKRRFGGNWE